MPASGLGKSVFTNWPIKITALVLSAILWVVTTGEEPTTQLIPVKLEVSPPPGRALTFDLPQVQALYAGTARELIQLFASPPTIRMEIPDTASEPEYTLHLSPEDLTLAFSASVQPQDVQPRTITIVLDDRLRRTVAVKPRVTVVPEPGFDLLSGISIAPDSLEITGPRRRVEQIDSLVTEPVSFRRIRAPLRELIDVDTTGFGPVTLSRYSVTVSADVDQITERVLVGIPITVRRDPSSWILTPPAVAVTAQGPASRLSRLTRDNIEALIAPRTGESEQVLQISVRGPAGIVFNASPDTVIVQSRDGT